MKKSVVFIIIVLIAIAGGIWYYNSSNQQTSIEDSSPNDAKPSDVNVAEDTQEDSTPNSGETAQTEMTESVLIKGYSFSPSTITVKAGTKVTWTNEDSVGHTVTSDSGSELDSSLLSKGQTYSHVFEKAGTYSYHCKPHPGMKGKIIVE